MRTPHFSDTILNQHTTNRLLQALKAGVLDMAYFPELYFQGTGEKRALSGASPEELDRLEYIHGKIKYDDSGQVTLGRDIKIRLLNAIRVGRINLEHDFPELGEAYRAVQMDMSAVTPEEDEFVLNMAIRNS